MRPTIIKTFLILFLTSSAWGQTTIRGTTTITSDGISSDTINNSPNKDFENRINLRPIDSSDYKLEIRLYRLTAVTNKRTLRIVKFYDDKWEGLEFEENRKSSKVITHVIAPTLGYATFLRNLIEQNIFTLPNQSEVDKRIENSYATKKEALSSRPYVMDGYIFTVEFKIEDKFRIYQFSNPDSYSKYYKNVEEFKNYSSIQKMFEQDLVRK